MIEAVKRPFSPLSAMAGSMSQSSQASNSALAIFIAKLEAGQIVLPSSKKNNNPTPGIKVLPVSGVDRSSSWIWSYARRAEAPSKVTTSTGGRAEMEPRVVCLLCNKDFSLKGGSTGPFIKHFKLHETEVQELQLLPNGSPTLRDLADSGQVAINASEASIKHENAVNFAGKPSANSYARLLVKMAAVHHYPFTMADNPDLRLMIKAAGYKGNMPCRMKVSNTVGEEFSHLKKTAQDTMRRWLGEDNALVCICPDNWTSANYNQFMGVYCYFVHPSFKKICKVLIGFKETPDGHSAEICKDILDETITDWGLWPHIGGVVSDAGSDIQAGIKLLLESKSIPATLVQHKCIAHVVNRGVRDFINASPALTYLCQVLNNLVSHLRRSAKRVSSWRQACIDAFLKDGVMLNHDMEVRWSSTYNLMQRVLDYKEAVLLWGEELRQKISPEEKAAEAEMLDHAESADLPPRPLFEYKKKGLDGESRTYTGRRFLPCDAEWRLMEEVIPFFEKCAEVTESQQADTKPTLPQKLHCYSMLLDAAEEGRVSGAAHLKEAYMAFTRKLRKYYDQTGDLYWAGQFVNPADKLKLITDEFEKEASAAKARWQEACKRAQEQGKTRMPSQWHPAYQPSAENPIAVLEKILSLLLAAEESTRCEANKLWQAPVPAAMLYRLGSVLSETALEYHCRGQPEGGDVCGEGAANGAAPSVGDKRPPAPSAGGPRKKHLQGWMQSKMNTLPLSSPVAQRSSLEAEVQAYLQHPWPVCEGELDLLEWYKDVGAPKFPRISRLAKWIFSIPSSSGGVERIFSKAGLDCSQRRHSLSSEKQAQLACLRSFYELLEAEREDNDVGHCVSDGNCPCCTPVALSS